MIKSIFEEDEEEKTDEGKARDSLSILDSEPVQDSSAENASKVEKIAEDEAVQEEMAALNVSGPDDLLEVPGAGEVDLEAQIHSIEKELSSEENEDKPDTVVAVETDPLSSQTVLKTEESSPPPAKTEIEVPLSSAPAETTAESIRNSGLAYSAAIALTGSIVFMLVMGWFADLLLGTAPWGIVIGIIIGAAIGFMQFFRLTSRIINPKPTDFEKVSLMNQADTDMIEDSVQAASHEPVGSKSAFGDAADVAESPAPDPSENETRPTTPESTKI